MGQLITTPSLDGYIQLIFQGTWAAARGGTSGTANKTATESQIRGELGFHVGRGFFVFDLSTIPAGAEIESASLAITVTGTTAVDVAHGTLHLVESTQASDSDLVNDDFNNHGSTNFANTVDASTTGAKTFTFDSTGLAYLAGKIDSKAMLCIRTKKDVDNTQPTGAGNMNVSMVDHATSGDRPTLTVTYTTKGGGFVYLMI